MKSIFTLFLTVFLMLSAAQAQLDIYMDNEDPTFIKEGRWRPKNNDECYGGTGLRAKKGDGSIYVQWPATLLFPGEYEVFVNVINGDYAKDAHFVIHAVTGDTLALIDQYEQVAGWYSTGIYDLPETTWVQLSDFWESDTGTYVFADAIHLVPAMPLYSLAGTLELAAANPGIRSRIEISKAGHAEPYQQLLVTGPSADYQFEELPNGWYDLRCISWGYDTLQVDSLHIADADISDYLLQPQATADPQYSISGTILLNDACDTTDISVAIQPHAYSWRAGEVTLAHGEAFTFSNLPAADYRLCINAPAYFPDSTTFAQISLTDGDQQLDTLTLYRFFRFAWITDSHIGVSFTESDFTETMADLNAMQDEIAFVIHTGDITEKGLNWEFDRYLSYISSCQLPIYHVPGNHDTKWTESGLQRVKSLFGDVHFSFDYEGVHFVGINSGIPMRGGGGYFDPSEIRWLEEDLANMESPDMPVIACWHHPADFSGVSDNWKVLDILKQYNTWLAMVGHGHNNHVYNFEGVPGAMGTATYDSNGGFNLVTVSELGIDIATCYIDSRGMSNPWHHISGANKIQPEIEFTNLEEHENLTETREIQIHTSRPMKTVSWDLRNDSPGPAVMSGSGTDWTFTLNPEEIGTGYHTLTIAVRDSNQHTYKKTRGFYTDIGYPRALWRHHCGATIITKPAHDGERVYFGSSDGRICALDFNTGEPVWEPVQTNGAVFSSPALADSLLLIGSADGKLYAIRTQSGEISWTFDTGTALLSAPVVVDTLVYFGSNNRFYAVSLNSHESLWEFETGYTIECRPAVDDSNVVFTSWDNYVYCLDRFSGEQKWKWNHQTSFYYAPGASWPVIGGGKVFTGDPKRFLNAIDLQSGETVWQSVDPEIWESVGISSNGSQVYSRTLYGDIYAYSTQTSGKHKLWQTECGNAWDSSPSMIVEKDGAVFSGSAKGYVISITNQTGNLNWKYWASQSYITTVTPIDANRVLAAALDGSIALIAGDPEVGLQEGEKAPIPLENQLHTPYPNPFNSSLTIPYSLRDRQDVRVAIYDLMGREVHRWSRRAQSPGHYMLFWNGLTSSGEPVSSGIYILKITGEQFSDTRKLSFLK